MPQGGLPTPQASGGFLRSGPLAAAHSAATPRGGHMWPALDGRTPVQPTGDHPLTDNHRPLSALLTTLALAFVLVLSTTPVSAEGNGNGGDANRGTIKVHDE